MEELIVSRRAWALPRVKSDPNLYFKVMNDEPIILLLDVDDLFLTRKENLITD
jgi:hypothetical protein